MLQSVYSVMVGCKDDLDGLLEPAPIGPSKPVSRQPQRPRHSVPAVAPRAPNALRARTAASVRPGPAPCNAHRLRPLPESARAQETAESTEKQADADPKVKSATMKPTIILLTIKVFRALLL